MKILRIKRKALTFSASQIGYFLIVCIAVARAMQFHVNYGDNMDLARHFSMMNLIKNSGYSFFEYVFLHGDAFTTNITLRYSYFFNAIIYYVCKHTDNYYLVSWLFVLLDYSIIAYIGVDWWRSQGGRSVSMALYEILCCFSLFPFIHAVSGMRTSLAACMAGLGLYQYLYKNTDSRKILLLSLVTATIHPIYLTVIPFAVLAKKLDMKKGLIIAIIISSVVFLVANVLSSSSNGFLFSLALKYLHYTGEGGYRSTRFCYYGVILICLLTLASYFLRLFNKGKRQISRADQAGKYEKKAVENLYSFIAYYMIFILSNIGAYEMVMRPAYLLGAMAPLVTGMTYGVGIGRKSSNGILTLIQILLFALTCYVSYMYLIWHSEFFS